MYPTHTPLDNRGAIISIILIWMFSFLLASPLTFFSHIDSVDSIRYECTELSSKQYFCELKLVYSIFGMLFQYLLPFIILLTVYTKIYERMKRRMRKHSHISKAPPSLQDQPSNVNLLQTSSRNSQINSFQLLKEQKHLNEINRQRKVNILLFSIAIVFALSWLPLNINNMVMDFHLFYFNRYPENESTNNVPPTVQPGINYPQRVTIIQAICLLLVLSSACTNPILYSWLNENFRNEFQRFLFWQKTPNHPATSKMGLTNSKQCSELRLDIENTL